MLTAVIKRDDGGALKAKSNLSQEHEDLLEMRDSESIQSILSARQTFVSEKRGTSSSVEVEQALASYLYSSATSPVFDIVSAFCVETICELQGRVYSDSPLDDWSNMINGMYDLPLWRKFSTHSTVMLEKSGQLVAITYLFRKP